MNCINASVAMASLAAAVLAPFASDAQAGWSRGFGGDPDYRGETLPQTVLPRMVVGALDFGFARDRS